MVIIQQFPLIVSVTDSAKLGNRFKMIAIALTPSQNNPASP